MATTAKAVAIMRELKDKVSKRVAATMSYAVSSADASDNPVLTLSYDATPATGEKVVVLRVRPITWTSKDVMGNADTMFTPNYVDVCTEANYAATNDNIADILTPAELLPVIGECIQTGCMVNWYVSPNGTVPATAQMTTAQLGATYQALYFGASKAQ
jgi:hypothetical protein